MALGDGNDVLSSLMRDSLDHCVKCTICETFCPVSNVTEKFPGPKYVGPQAERFRVQGQVSPDDSLDYCSGCGICTQVCPQGVHIAEINTQARAKLRERTGFKLRDRLVARPNVLGRLGTPAAPIANFTLNNKAVRLPAHPPPPHDHPPAPPPPPASSASTTAPPSPRSPGARSRRGRAGTTRRPRSAASPTSTAAARTGT